MDTDNKTRCKWCLKDPLYIKYHDEEWGEPIYNDEKIFEILLLETFQAGLSWITILRKRENFRKAFDNFDYKIISNYSNKKLKELQLDPGIVRNKLKINAAKTNAISFLNVQKEFETFSNYIWGFTNRKQIKNNFNAHNKLPEKTKLSDKISNDLKKRGFKFVGSTIIYAQMQAMGIVNDHTLDCFRHKEIFISNI